MALNQIVLIDTSAWICFFARKGFDALKRSIFILLDENRAAIIGPILVEMIQGCRTEAERNDLNEVFGTLHRFAVAEELWDAAADLSFSLRRKGITSSVVDSLIAAAAIRYQLSLLHHDSDFDRIARYSDLTIFKTDHRPEG